MNDLVLQRLANIATVRGHVANILNVGRGVIPKPELHKLQAEGTKLDRLFVSTMLDNTTNDEEEDLKSISQRIAEEKTKMVTKSVAHVSVQEATEAALNTVDTVNVSVKKKKTKKKTKKKAAKKVKDPVVVVNAPQ